MIKKRKDVSQYHKDAKDEAKLLTEFCPEAR